jgi:hypothetical protein
VVAAAGHRDWGAAAVWRQDVMRPCERGATCVGGCGLPDGYPLPMRVAGVGKFQTRHGCWVRVTGGFNPRGAGVLLCPPHRVSHPLPSLVSGFFFASP